MFSVPVFPIFLSFSIFHQTQCIYSPKDFFPVEDVTSVVWAHAVNSQQELDESLADPSIRMIEADSLRGRINVSGIISPPWDIAIMAHPPANTSDLSFVSFIDQMIRFNADKGIEEMKGVKLDFKDYFAAASAITTLRQRNTTSNGTALKFPIWLNADVVKGPVDSESEPKIKGVDLLKLHEVNLPGAVLSLGWTTKLDEGVSNAEYKREHIDSMIQVFRNFSQTSQEEMSKLPVTFAVRAAIAQNSLGNLLYLLNATSYQASLTFWAGANDPKVNITLMDDMFKLVGKRRTFIDLPYEGWRASSGSSFVVNLSLLSFAVLSCFQ